MLLIKNLVSLNGAYRYLYNSKINILAFLSQSPVRVATFKVTVCTIICLSKIYKKGNNV